MFCMKLKSVSYKLTHKEKQVMNHSLCTEQEAKKPHHPNQMAFDEIKLQACSDALIPNMRPPRGIHTIKAKNSLSMRSVCKKLHHIRNNEIVFMHDTQT